MSKKENKNSFIFFTDYKKHFELLSGDESKELLFAIFDYHTNNTINKLPPACEMAFSFMKIDMDISAKKYADQCARNRINGSKGGRPKEPKKPSGLINNQPEPTGFLGNPQEHDNDNDNDNKKKTTEKKNSPGSELSGGDISFQDRINGRKQNLPKPEREATVRRIEKFIFKNLQKLMEEEHLPKWRNITPERKRKINLRAASISNIKAWRELFRLLDEKKLQWKGMKIFNADFILESDGNIYKFLEGKYNDLNKPKENSTQLSIDTPLFDHVDYQMFYERLVEQVSNKVLIKSLEEEELAKIVEEVFDLFEEGKHQLEGKSHKGRIDTLNCSYGDRKPSEFYFNALLAWKETTGSPVAVSTIKIDSGAWKYFIQKVKKWWKTEV